MYCHIKYQRMKKQPIFKTMTLPPRNFLSIVPNENNYLNPISDVTTLRGAFESIMRQHYPGMVGHIVIKCVPCPNICSETLAILNHLRNPQF